MKKDHEMLSRAKSDRKNEQNHLGWERTFSRNRPCMISKPAWNQDLKVLFSLLGYYNIKRKDRYREIE